MSDNNKKIEEKEKIALSSQDNMRISVRKMALVANVIRGKESSYVIDYLRSSDKKSAKLLLNLVQSALSNLGTNNAYVYDVKVGQGVTTKRLMPVSRGRSHRIRKRTSNVKVLVKENSLNNSKDKTKGVNDE